MQTGHSGRPLGVGVSAKQLSAGQGAPLTLGQAMPIQMYALQFADESGALHNEVALVQADGVVYLLPDGERWASQLRPAAKWLAEKVRTVVASAALSTPVTDSVDVINPSVDEAARAHSEATK